MSVVGTLRLHDLRHGTGVLIGETTTILLEMRERENCGFLGFVESEGDIHPYFFTKYMKNSGSFFFTEIMAPTTENDVAYHGPGNLESGCKN